MSLESVTSNIDLQLANLDKTLADCEAQLAQCDAANQPILVREIDALKTTRVKLIKSRSLAEQAHALRQQIEQPLPPPPGRWLFYTTLALLLCVLVVLGYLILS